MITYTYRCKKCDVHYEYRLPPDHCVTPVCPECKTELTIVVHAPGIFFKGDGWTKKGDKRG